MDEADFELLERIEQGGHIFRPTDQSRDARIAFQRDIDNLLRLRGVGLVSLPERRLMRAEDGSYLMAGPCDLTPAGVAALTHDRSLGPRPPRKTQPRAGWPRGAE